MKNTAYTYEFLKSIVKDIKPNYAITKNGGRSDIKYLNNYLSSINIPTSYNCLDSFLEQMYINLQFGHNNNKYKVYAIVSNWKIFIYNDTNHMRDSISCDVILSKHIDDLDMDSSEDITINFDINIPRKVDRNKLLPNDILDSRELLTKVIDSKVNMMRREQMIDKILDIDV